MKHGEQTTGRNGRYLLLQLFLSLSSFLLLILAGCSGSNAPDTSSSTVTERQAMIATRGIEVMPFDLEQTTHIFEKRENGGLQQVIADDPADEEQIRLIRTHLVEEAERFQQGDFHDPAMLHGEEMAGLHELMLGAERIVIAYSELPDGAQILYTTADAELVSALHVWFDAQVIDHGDHAVGSP